MVCWYSCNLLTACVPENRQSEGVMISEGTPHIVSGQCWKSLFPDAALILMTAGFILIGEGINAGAERSSM